MKKFVKTMNQDGHSFKFLIDKFPSLSEAKVKKQIRLEEESSSKRRLESSQGSYLRIFRQEVITTLI